MADASHERCKTKDSPCIVINGDDLAANGRCRPWPTLSICGGGCGAWPLDTNSLHWPPPCSTSPCNPQHHNAHRLQTSHPNRSTPKPIPGKAHWVVNSTINNDNDTTFSHDTVTSWPTAIDASSHWKHLPDIVVEAFALEGGDITNNILRETNQGDVGSIVDASAKCSEVPWPQDENSTWLCDGNVNCGKGPGSILHQHLLDLAARP